MVLYSKEKIIEFVQDIIAEYGSMRLTVRQIYYRLVAAQKLINKLSSYKRLSQILVDARKKGDIDFEDIEDRTRTIDEHEREEETPEDYFRDWYDTVLNIGENYDLPLWWGQDTKVVVMIEKQALSSLFEMITKPLNVDQVVCRGYPSLTLLYELAGRVDEMSDARDVQFLYFGDYDPSGTDIERHVKKELTYEFGLDFSTERVAITRDQIEEYNIPPAPAKTSDARYDRFVAEEGVAWQVELDAIEPKTLQRMVKSNILRFFDNDINNDRKEETEDRRVKLREWVKKAFREDFEPPED